MYGDVVLRCAAIGPDGNETHVNVFPTSLNELNHQRLDFGRAPPLELIWAFMKCGDNKDIYQMERRSPTWKQADSIEIKEVAYTRSPVVVFEGSSYRISLHPKKP